MKTLSQPAALTKGKSDVSHEYMLLVYLCRTRLCAKKQVKYTLCCVGIKVWLGRKHSATGEKMHIFAIRTLGRWGLRDSISG